MPKSIVVLLALATCALPAPARADCSLTGTIVTYYSEPDQSSLSTDKRCSLVRNTAGQLVCRIAMKGIWYKAQRVKADAPAIIYNHGSEHSFTAQGKACAIAEYFTPMGYHVFAPFRRGQGEVPEACLDPEPADTCDKRGPNRKPAYECPLGPNESTGMYISQAKALGGDSAVLWDEQVLDVIDAFKWLRAHPEVADNAIAIGGNSYGGIVSVLVNAKEDSDRRVGIGHRAVLAFSPGAISWANDAGVGNRAFQTMMTVAAAQAKMPAYYLQGRFDHDTRAALELAYQHGMKSSEPQHGMRPANWGVFEWPYPAVDPCSSSRQPDWQSVHTGFAGATELWGPAVLDFLKRNGVK